MAAPEISKHALAGADSNIGQVVESMRFINPANLTGLPAISVPAGYDQCGLPVGLHLTGRSWNESRLFSMAYAAESIVARQRPIVHFDLLPELGELGRKITIGQGFTNDPAGRRCLP